MVAANYALHKVSVFNISGSSLTHSQTFGSYGTGNSYFSNPTDAVFDSNGNIYVTDLYNHRLVKYNSSGTYQSQYGSWNYNGNPFRYPYGLGISSTDKIYVADHSQSAVQEFTTGMSYQGKIGVAKSRMDMAKEVIKKDVTQLENSDDPVDIFLNYLQEKGDDKSLEIKRFL